MSFGITCLSNGGRGSWSYDNFVELFDSTPIETGANEGLRRYAECCPLGSAHLLSFAIGVRGGLADIVPRLIGQDPHNIGQINQIMDTTLPGARHAKAPMDSACWESFGKNHRAASYSRTA